VWGVAPCVAGDPLAATRAEVLAPGGAPQPRALPGSLDLLKELWLLGVAVVSARASAGFRDETRKKPGKEADVCPCVGTPPPARRPSRLFLAARVDTGS
jgi:hypothetical protein